MLWVAVALAPKPLEILLGTQRQPRSWWLLRPGRMVIELCYSHSHIPIA